jgi:hypothetical protein
VDQSSFMIQAGHEADRLYYIRMPGREGVGGGRRGNSAWSGHTGTMSREFFGPDLGGARSVSGQSFPRVLGWV